MSWPPPLPSPPHKKPLLVPRLHSPGGYLEHPWGRTRGTHGAKPTRLAALVPPRPREHTPPIKGRSTPCSLIACMQISSSTPKQAMPGDALQSHRHLDLNLWPHLLLLAELMAAVGGCYLPRCPASPRPGLRGTAQVFCCLGPLASRARVGWGGHKGDPGGSSGRRPNATGGGKRHPPIRNAPLLLSPLLGGGGEPRHPRALCSNH